MTTVGGDPFYAIPEDAFLRDVNAQHVDRQIVTRLQQRIRAVGDAVIDGVLDLLGEEDLFARASIELAIDRMDQVHDARAVDVDQFRTALWMAGFRAVIDVHDDLLRLEFAATQGPLDV